jgi:DNA-binding response OmpR family regulator
MNSNPAAASNSHGLRLLGKIDGSKINILIVEDNDSSRRLVVELLRASGFNNLTVARTAEDAIEQMQGLMPDLILLDWGLPGMSGLDLARTIRHAAVTPDPRFSNPAVPMIMLTARQSARDVTLARNTGIDEFVIKPFSTVSILKAICSCILRRRPFIVSAGYVGPCRRRAKSKTTYTGLLRRASDIEAVAEENAKRQYKESLSVELNGLRAHMQARGGLTPKMLEYMVSRVGQAEEDAHRFRLKLIEQATHSLHDYMDVFGDAADPEVLDVHLDALIQLNDAPTGDNVRASAMVRNLKALVAKRKSQRRAVA